MGDEEEEEEAEGGGGGGGRRDGRQMYGGRVVGAVTEYLGMEEAVGSALEAHELVALRLSLGALLEQVKQAYTAGGA